MIFVPLLFAVAIYFDLKHLRRKGANVRPVLVAVLFLASFYLAGYFLALAVGFEGLPWLMLVPLAWIVGYFLFRFYKARALKSHAVAPTKT
jgi:hypothetical protein